MPNPPESLTSFQEEKLRFLKNTRNELMAAAEKAAHAYACECDVGEERIKAFEIYENLRNAGRVY